MPTYDKEAGIKTWTLYVETSVVHKLQNWYITIYFVDNYFTQERALAVRSFGRHSGSSMKN